MLVISVVREEVIAVIVALGQHMSYSLPGLEFQTHIAINDAVGETHTLKI